MLRWGARMHMTEEDYEMLDGSLKIMHNMFNTLRDIDVKQAQLGLKDLDQRHRERYARKDRKDTLFFDVVAEDAITLGWEYIGHDALFKKVYNQSGVIITEERGKIGSSRIEHNTPVIISDPTDRSSYLEQLIREHEGACATMGEVFDREHERIGDAHARVEAVNSSVTLLKDNMIKYTIVLSMFTGEVFVAYPAGVFFGGIQDAKKGHAVFTQRAQFKEDETLNMLCYTEEGKDEYESNITGTHLRFFPLDLTIKKPGGPNRFTYLLQETEGQQVSSIGVIAHNGEKIQESLPNIAVAFFSGGQLRAYKLFCDWNFAQQRAGKELTPNLQNSIYNNGLLVNTGIKLMFLNNYQYPSEFRDTTVIIPVANNAAGTLMDGMVRREYAIRII